MSLTKQHREAERWWQTAAEDLDAARFLRQGQKHAHACFLCQQSAEKAMKALWLAIGEDPWGHSIQKLIQEYPRQELFSNLETWLTSAAVLDKFYIPTRYPNGLPDLTPAQVYLAEEADQALERAEFFLDHSRALLNSLLNVS